MLRWLRSAFSGVVIPGFCPWAPSSATPPVEYGFGFLDGHGSEERGDDVAGVQARAFRLPSELSLAAGL